VENGADVNAATTDGRTSLLFAAADGDSELVKLLLDAGANVNAKSDDGDTSLSLAVEEGHREIVNTLKARGAPARPEK
jgi:ankyrin repeat protein